ncbi:MAG: efflux RND transporter periplasmic adaptor subunit [Gemmatimonadetes bacterium]|nr:efflux RND transporter periplasmic adaptor subunit [Gemmatimonadota bacterium]
MTRRRKIVIGSIILVVGLVAVSSAVGGGRDKAVAVRVGSVERRDLVASVTASGQVSPKRSVDISSDITGRIIAISVEEGDEVVGGQLLLTIDPAQYIAAVNRSEAALASARASELQARANRDQALRASDRSRRLRETDSILISAEQLEIAETNYQVAEAVLEAQRHQVTQAQAALEQAMDERSKTVITAPMEGKITRLAVEVGEVALASTFSRETGLLMTISDLSVMQVDVQVDETDVVRLEFGDSAEVTIDAFPDTTFIGVITKIAQSARIAAASAGADQAVDYDVEITLTNPPEQILPDLSATAKIITDVRSQVLSIPIIALTVREHTPISTEVSPQDTTTVDTEGVFLIQDGTAQFRPVEIGISGEEHFEVLSGLADGDSIVAGPFQTIRELGDSSQIRPMNDENQTPSS